MKTKLLVFGLLVLFVGLLGCSKGESDDPEPVRDTEEIASLKQVTKLPISQIIDPDNPSTSGNYVEFAEIGYEDGQVLEYFFNNQEASTKTDVTFGDINYTNLDQYKLYVSPNLTTNDVIGMGTYDNDSADKYYLSVKHNNTSTITMANVQTYQNNTEKSPITDEAEFVRTNPQTEYTTQFDLAYTKLNANNESEYSFSLPKAKAIRKNTVNQRFSYPYTLTVESTTTDKKFTYSGTFEGNSAAVTSLGTSGMQHVLGRPGKGIIHTMAESDTILNSTSTLSTGEALSIQWLYFKYIKITDTEKSDVIVDGST